MEFTEIYYHQLGNNRSLKACILTPEVCPICHKYIEPSVWKEAEYIDKISKIFIVFFCNSCKHPFVAEYSDLASATELTPANYELYPQKYEYKKFDKIINDISPKFEKIYNEALQAENSKLILIAGMGYRKSLEFLIKDYCILKNKDKENDIKKLQLGSVIHTYLEKAEKIQTCAKAAAWLGNDESHYVRIWENKDITDLKKFINATVYFIEYDLSYEDAEEMNEEEKKRKGEKKKSKNSND